MNNASSLLLKHCVEKISKTSKAEMSFGYLVTKEKSPSFINVQSSVVVSNPNLLSSTRDLIGQQIINSFSTQECAREGFFLNSIDIKSSRPDLLHKNIINVCYLPIIENDYIYGIVILVNIEIADDTNVLIDLIPFLSTAVNLLKGSMSYSSVLPEPVDRLNDKLIENLLINTFHPALLFDDELKVVKANSASQRIFNSNTLRGWVALDQILKMAMPNSALQVFSTISKFSFLGHLDCTHWSNVTFLLNEYQSVIVDIHLFEYKQANKQFFGLMLNEKDQDKGVNSEEYHASIQRFKALTSVIPTAILQVDNHWQCSYINETWTRYTGLDLERSKGLKWLNCLSIEDRESLLPKMLSSTSQSKHFRKEIQLCSTINKNIWVELHVAGMFNDRYE